eukprot:CAMPEP_0198236258 /NCGR_PEP_ID=MMETSP1446-20131203/2155_1 /TAXON_ID=1461542 ORGANISM="Unidentified sp, Strain CCMP2111" /NCGR_SAMPLE_ID=MMETSP1446 /ASSEMBLY_ACC=CAM_ASM_001112 /LENGTH=39 /DNA_ID= /DNA_START= /DNA_END= /DNA_ORIENTATION=
MSGDDHDEIAETKWRLQKRRPVAQIADALSETLRWESSN